MRQSIICGSCHAPVANPHARNCMHCGTLLGLPPGTLIGNQYRVVRSIGAGGAGSIYLAEDMRTFNRRCVLKRLNIIHNPSERARFTSEVQILTQLRHPQFPQVFAFLEEAGQPYIVMEYVVGHDLAYNLSATQPDGTLRPGRPRPLSQVLHDGITICSMLEHLHSRKPAVVHCDIKPANLIRDAESNALFLVDFGAAMSSGSGEVFGTPGYAAPEQYRGQRFPASDIYATAATIYHLLTDDDPADHPHQFPRLGHLPAPVSQALEQCLHAEPRARPTALQLREQLERCLRMPVLPDSLSAPDGSPISSLAELAATAQQHASWLSNAAVEGQLQRWLRDQSHFELLHWFNAERINQPLPGLLRQLVQRINPALPPTEVRVSQQRIELDDRNAHQPVELLLTARNGAAEVRLHTAPIWVQVAPASLELQPNTTARLHIGLDPDRAPRHGSRDLLVFEIVTSTSAPQQLRLPVVVGQLHTGTARRPTGVFTLWWLIGTWCGLMLLLGAITINLPALQNLALPLALGGLVGSLVAWVAAGDWITTAVAIGMAMLAAAISSFLLGSLFPHAPSISAAALALSSAAALGGSLLGTWLLSAVQQVY